MAMLLALGFAATANAQPTSNWLDYTAIAQNRLAIGSNIEVSGSHIGLALNAEVYRHLAHALASRD